ncbi:MAG TPA: aminotransferase class V-fold PLP-dependent enzyme, partial [Gemmataceae bacterium]|nr:aminotransferase class V-fold PLP-dependent enzyme [Gemmataceae bacterium]
GPNTAGVLHVYDVNAAPPLAELVRRAHAAGLPVLVDAAGELPPRANLRNIIATGADLVVFSGGKAIRGPQATGILCGKRDLVGSALLQMLDMDDHFELWEPPANLIDKSKLPGIPRHGIGRALKVSKEQIAALLIALELFASGAYERELGDMARYCQEIAESLRGCPVTTRLLPSDGQSYPLLEITLAPGRCAVEVCRSLRAGNPSVQLGHLKLAQGTLIVHPLHLNGDRTKALIGRLRAELSTVAQ